MDQAQGLGGSEEKRTRIEGFDPDPKKLDDLPGFGSPFDLHPHEMDQDLIGCTNFRVQARA